MIRSLVAVPLISFSLYAQEVTPRSVKMDPGNHRVWLQVGELKREFLLHVPESYDGRSAPLVLVLHGSGGTLDGMANVSNWMTQSETERYLVAFANGFPNGDGMRVWNDGRRREGDSGADDVAFVKALIDDVSDRLKVDRKRIYVVGFSNGAGMAYRLAVEIGDRIASIAPVAGRIGMPVEKLGHPVAAIAIVGTKDGGYASDVKSIDRWAELIGCQPPKDTVRRGRYVSTAYEKCPSKADVISYTIEDWEHYWPGGKNPGVEGWGEDTIWNFFKKHALITVKTPE